MANIKVTIDFPIVNGQPLTFKSPADCSQVTGLVVSYPEGGENKTKSFQFADAHGNNLTGLGHLFVKGSIVKAILSLDSSRAYLQNADTNKYLEDKFKTKADLENGKVPASQLPSLDFIPTKEKGAADGVAPMYTYGTEDIEPGSASTAANGTLHFVFE